ncbi:MAG: tetratricopeptide repeat protein [Chryseosolibacter sp.]
MFRSVYFVFGMLILSNGMRAQDQIIVDSLLQVLDTAGVQGRFLALYEMTFQYAQKDNEKALQLICESEDVAFESGNHLWMVKSKRVRGQLLYFVEKIPEAENELCDALAMAMTNGYKAEQLHIQNTLSKIYIFKGDYDNALKLDFRVLDLAYYLSDSAQIALAFNSAAFTYYKLKDYERALNYYKKVLGLVERVDNLELSSVLANISLCYANLKEFSVARDHAEWSLKICGSACSGKPRINIEYAFGVIDFGEGDLHGAEEHFLKSYDLAKRFHDTRFQLDNIYMLADIKMEQRYFRDAESFLLQGEDLIDVSTPFKLEMIKIFSAFSKLYMVMQNFRKAAYYQGEYISLKDHIYNEDLTTNLMRTESEYLERENGIRIASQDEIIDLKEQIIVKQSILNRITLLLVLFFVVCIILLFRSYKQNKYLNRLLEGKIGERTRELQLSRDELLSACQEYSLLLKRTSRSVIETSRTIKGLCVIGRKEVNDPLALLYIEQIDRVTSRLEGFLNTGSSNNR